jgi:hypothetical protein
MKMPVGSHRYKPPILQAHTGIGKVAGDNLASFPLAICIKKSAKQRVYSVLRIIYYKLLADFLP